MHLNCLRVPFYFAMALTLFNGASFASSTFSSNQKFLRELVEISSGTQEIKGVDRIQEIIASRLRTLGFKVQFKLDSKGKSGKLVVARRAGNTAGSKVITLLVHADTVFGAGSNFVGWKESPDHLWASGPGAIDDKGGIVVALAGLELYLKHHPNSGLTLRVISSPGEEAGTPAFAHLFPEYARDTHVVLGFEPALDDGSIIGGRRGNRWYLISVLGREAHAGRAHREGINACLEVALKAAAISELTDFQKDVTASIGHIEGGKDKFNIVCGSAQAKIDTRAGDRTAQEELHQKILEILKTPKVRAASDHQAAQITYEISDGTFPFSITEKSKPFLETYTQYISKIEGSPIKIGRSGGSADSNKFVTDENVVLDGLGPVGEKMHTTGERIFLPSLDSRSQALADFLEWLENKKD